MKFLFALGLAFSVLPAEAQDLLSCREAAAKDAFQISVEDGATVDKANLYAGIFSRERGVFDALAILETGVSYSEVQGDALPHQYTHKASVNGQELSNVISLDSAKKEGQATLSWAPGTILPCWVGDANDAGH